MPGATTETGIPNQFRHQYLARRVTIRDDAIHGICRKGPDIAVAVEAEAVGATGIDDIIDLAT
ncbi:MAG: hypothetical protein R3D32_08835 [Nitratireductor sp.]